MDLVVKVTDRCNFNCQFCSSTEIGSTDINAGQIISLMKCYNNDIGTIVFNGGDPLLINPDEYIKLLKYIEDNKLNTYLSFTTNLWDFFWNPQKWTDIFKHERVGVITSFQFDETRKLKSGEPFTEKLFWVVSDLFLSKVGYRPGFISVLTSTYDMLPNGKKIINLARQMEVECKINYVNASGKASYCIPVGYAALVYQYIYENGWEQYEYNTKQFLKTIRGEETTCPLAMNCDKNIRCFQPNGFYSCPAFADDGLYGFTVENDIKNLQTPLSNDPDLVFLMEKCLSCPAYKLCHGCKKHIYDLKRINRTETNIIESNCITMTASYNKIIERMNNESKGNTLYLPIT